MGICCSDTHSEKQDDTSEKEKITYQKLPKKEESTNKIKNGRNSNVKVIESTEDIKITSEMLTDNIGVNPLDHYDIVNIIAENQYGSFHLVRHKESKIQRVMKQFHFNNQKVMKETLSKLMVFKHLDHPMILKFNEIFYYEGKLYVLSQFFEKGGLEAVIAEKKFLNEKQTAMIVYNVLLGLIYAHKHDVIHGYLNPENILIESENNDTFSNIKIKELSFVMTEFTYKIDKKISTVNYMPPEILLDKPFDISCDLWSVGILAYHLIEGKTPFECKRSEDTEKKIINYQNKLDFIGERIGKSSSLAKDFIKKLIIKEPAQRLSAKEALDHKWFDKFSLKQKSTVVEQSKMNEFMKKMCSFESEFKLQQICIALIVHNIPSDNEIKLMEKAFTSMDVNLDGHLTREELLLGIKNIFRDNYNHIKPENLIDQIFRNVDSDKSGTITYEEFVCACIDKNTLLEDKYLTYTFSSFDSDGSGYITCNELEAVLSGDGQNPVSKEVCLEIMKEVDIKGRGKVNFKEFKLMMEKILN